MTANLKYFFYSLQGLPSCPVSLEALRSHLPYLGYCLNFSDEKNERTDDDSNTNNNNNFVISDLYGNQKEQFAPNLTPLHRFYREQQQRKKMPGFRGRRGLCGCFQVNSHQNTFQKMCIGKAVAAIRDAISRMKIFKNKLKDDNQLIERKKFNEMLISYNLTKKIVFELQ